MNNRFHQPFRVDLRTKSDGTSFGRRLTTPLERTLHAQTSSADTATRFRLFRTVCAQVLIRTFQMLSRELKQAG